MTRILVTGATGFVGRQLCKILAQRGYVVRAAIREDQALPVHIDEKIVVGEIGRRTDWSKALDHVDGVVHCAAVAHILRKSPQNFGQYMETNAYGTEVLARAAVRANIKRFVFLSSVKVNGENSAETPFTPLDLPRPIDDYAVSKLCGENHLLEIANATSMEAVIVRAPLIYGPFVRANFLRLMGWVDICVPLPFGSVSNRRSLVSIWNLCDLIGRLLEIGILQNRIFMVSDGDDLSTGELIRRIGVSMGRGSSLFNLPVSLLRVLARVANKTSEFDRLCGSLTVDISLNRTALGWVPLVSVEEALLRTAHWYTTGRENW